MPAAVQWDSDTPTLDSDGVVAGDAALGLKVAPPFRGAWRAGATLDVLLPSSTPGTWMGERSTRARPGALLSWERDPFTLFGGVAGVLRTPVDTGAGLSVENELLHHVAVAVRPGPPSFALFAGWTARRPARLEQDEPGERASEALSGMRARFGHGLIWELGAGKGMARGYGSTEIRLLLGLSWERVARPPEPRPVVEIAIPETPDRPIRITRVEEPLEVPEVDEPRWEEGELARVKEEAIEIRDPINFEFATEHILPESIPTLRYVAGLMLADPKILHLVIEGHTSEEGSFAYNYDLSIRRARAVWEELVLSGVHPDRISYRGMGEVMPGTLETDEAHLAANRQVIFRLTARLPEGQAPKEPPPLPALPWSGGKP